MCYALGMTTKTKSGKKDFAQVAFNVFQQASGEALPPKELEGKKADSRNQSSQTGSDTNIIVVADTGSWHKFWHYQTHTDKHG